MKAKKVTKYVNTSTGEIYGNKEQFVDMQFDDEEGYLFWNRKNHVKTFVEQPLPECFTWADQGRIGALKHYMLQDSQLLVYRSNNVLKPLGKYELARLWHLNERNCSALIRKMKTSGVVKEVKTNGVVYFALNPLYGLKTKRLSLIVFLWFQDELKEALPKWAINKFLEQAQELKPNVQIIK